MRSVPPTRYARSGDVSLAYQVFGEGPVTIVAVPPLAKNIEIAWECAQYRHYFERLASFSRYVHFDKRGTGASDRTVPVPSLDTHVDDLRAVMDAAGVDRAFIQGVSEGGPMAMLFAVTYPSRVHGLILDGTAAVLVPPSEAPEARVQRLAEREMWLERWGTEKSLTLAAMAPSVASDPWYRAWQPRYERQSASPAANCEDHDRSRYPCLARLCRAELDALALTGLRSCDLNGGFSALRKRDRGPSSLR